MFKEMSMDAARAGLALRMRMRGERALAAPYSSEEW